MVYWRLYYFHFNVSLRIRYVALISAMYHSLRIIRVSLHMVNLISVVFVWVVSVVCVWVVSVVYGVDGGVRVRLHVRPRRL